MEEKYIGDLRPEDIKKLQKEGIESKWVTFWEDFMCAESDKVVDNNQRFWHTSRLSFLAGYQSSLQEFIKLLKEDIYEDDFLGYHNKKTLKHYSKIIDKLFALHESKDDNNVDGEVKG